MSKPKGRMTKEREAELRTALKLRMLYTAEVEELFAELSADRIECKKRRQRNDRLVQERYDLRERVRQLEAKILECDSDGGCRAAILLPSDPVRPTPPAAPAPPSRNPGTSRSE